jgi:hypothetical protein
VGLVVDRQAPSAPRIHVRKRALGQLRPLPGVELAHGNPISAASTIRYPTARGQRSGSWQFGWNADPERLERARELAERIIALGPNKADSYEILAEVLVWAGRPEDSIRARFLHVEAQRGCR